MGFATAFCWTHKKSQRNFWRFNTLWCLCEVILAILRRTIISSEQFTLKSSLNFARIVALFSLGILCLVPGGYLGGKGMMTQLNLVLFTFSAGALVYFASFDKGIVTIPFFNRFLEEVGARSYAIYLIHLPAYLFTIEFFFPRLSVEERGNWQVGVVWFVAITVMVELSYRFIEKPMIRIGKKLIEAK